MHDIAQNLAGVHEVKKKQKLSTAEALDLDITIEL